MNYALPTLLMLSLSMNAGAQKVSEADVPQPVKAAFLKQFPKATDAKWEMEDKKNYEADFKQDGNKWSAAYSADGTWLETEHAIKPEALPEAVRKSIAAKYADHKLKETEQVDTPKGTFFEADLAKEGHSMDVLFTKDGSVVKTEADEDDKEDGEEDDKD